MFRPLTTELHTIYHKWSLRPFWSAWLLLLLGILIGSGPLACVVHCLVAGELHHTHHAHTGHAAHGAHGSAVADEHNPVFVINEHGDHGLCAYGMSHMADAPPSALTIGVVLSAGLALQVLVVALRRVDVKPHLRLIALPPPPDPPRIANSLI